MGNENTVQKWTPVQKAEQSARIYELKLQGRTHRSIAEEMGMSISTVQSRLDDAIAERPRHGAEEYRQLLIDRAEDLYAKAYNVLTSTNDQLKPETRLKAVDTIGRQLERLWEFTGNKTIPPAPIESNGDPQYMELQIILRNARERTIDGQVVDDGQPAREISTESS